MAQQQQVTPEQQKAMEKAKLQAANAQARALVLTQSWPMLQQISSQTVVPGNTPVLNIPPQNVGLITGFLVKVVATVANANGTPANNVTLTDFGPANILKTIAFTDLQNYQRINTTGWHMHFANSAMQQFPMFGSTALNGYPVGYGNNWTVMTAPSTIAGQASGTVTMYYWIPLAYSATDLSGSIYANVVNATMNLQLQFNTLGFAAATGTDTTEAVYTGAGAADTTMTSATVTVYQAYLDQLPMGQQGPILPFIDLNTMYGFVNTTLPSVTPNSDFYVQYSNFRHFLSTTAVYVNGVARNAGSDVNYWSLRTANMTDTRKADPATWAALARKRIQTDFPDGVYYFDTRDKPIFTTQNGNTNLVLNASSAAAGSRVLVGWEYLAQVSQLINAGSLAANV